MGAVTESDVVVVDVRGVDKRFTLRHSRSIKEYLVWTLRGRNGELSETFLALNDLSFQVRQGESIGLLGFNGSGKSTTLKMLSGVMRPDRGEVLIRGRIAGLIEVGAGFHPDLTGRENVFLNGAILGMSQAEIETKFDDIVAFSEIERFIDTEVKFYSSGMFLRLAFAVAVHSQPDIFLVDEILAVGDEPFQRKCIQRIRELKAQGQTLVVVSHDLDMIQRICDRGIVLDHGKLRYDGRIADAVKYLRETPPEPAPPAAGAEAEKPAKGGLLARLRGRQPQRGRPGPEQEPPMPTHLRPVLAEWNLQPWKKFRPLDLQPADGVQLDLAEVDVADTRTAEQPLAAPHATITVTGLGAGAEIGFRASVNATLTLRAAGADLVLATTVGEQITELARIERQPEHLALTLTGPTVTVWDTGHHPPQVLAQHRLPSSFDDVGLAAAQESLRVIWSGRMGALRAGSFGWLGLRDPHLVQSFTGEPVLRDGRLLLTFTCAGPAGPTSAHWAMFSLNPDDPSDLRHEADLWFERDGRRYGDHCGQLVVRDGQVQVLVSSWGDFDRDRPKVHIRTGDLAALPAASVVVATEPVELPSEFPTWSPDLRWCEDQWYLGFVECFGQTDRLEFRPVLAVADGDEQGRTGEWLRVGSDSVHHQTEGTLFVTDDRGRDLLVASDGDARDHPVYDLGMVRMGRLIAPYGSGIPHACLVKLPDADPLMITFDATPAGPAPLEGSHGDLLVYRTGD